jgi:predicted nuclease with TOPRIM domain
MLIIAYIAEACVIMSGRSKSHILYWAILLGLLAPIFGFAGVSRAIQDRYRRNYENKTIFLRLPVFVDRQMIYVTAKGARQETAAGSARFKVGDQFRVVGIDFGGDDIKFKLSSIPGAVPIEMIFKFDAGLQEDFPNSDVFDRALQTTFTEGLKLSDLEEAKRAYVEDQFENAVREIATTAGTTRETVLKAMAPRLPAYQDAQRDIENLKNRSQDLSAQVAQAQAEGRRVEAELKGQQAEVARLRTANSSLQERIDSSSSQLSRIGEELRDAKGLTQGYQKELASLQRSLNIRVDTNRDLAAQIGDLAQAMRKLQKDNEGLTNQSSSLRNSLEDQKSANTRLLGENDDLKASNKQMRETIDALASKEDSLARQYIQLKRAKENLEQITLATTNLSTRTVNEKTESGYYTGRVALNLRNIPLGFLDWRLPAALSPNAEMAGEASFSAESIDYVQVAPDERQILRSLGDRLKLAVKLSSPAETMKVRPGKEDAVQAVGERDRASWHWTVSNQGTADTSLVLNVRLINRNSDEIPLLQRESRILSASVVRQIRNYLQPIPLSLGVVVGFLLFGIIGIFRHPKTPRSLPNRPSPGSSNLPTQSGTKRL